MFNVFNCCIEMHVTFLRISLTTKKEFQKEGSALITSCSHLSHSKSCGDSLPHHCQKNTQIPTLWNSISNKNGPWHSPIEKGWFVFALLQISLGILTSKGKVKILLLNGKWIDFQINTRRHQLFWNSQTFRTKQHIDLLGMVMPTSKSQKCLLNWDSFLVGNLKGSWLPNLLL